MSRIQGNWAQVGPAIAEEQELAGRGIVVVIEAARRVTASHLHPWLPGAEVTDVDDVGDDVLITLNQRRDAWLPAGRSVVFRVAGGDGLRRLLRLAPDLTSIIDLQVELTERVVWSAERLRSAVCESQARLHQDLDLTGLVPHSGDAVTLHMDDVYLRDAGLAEDVRLADKPALVLGAPGAGKTTTLRWIAWRQATGQPVLGLPSGRAAVFVPLASWAAAARDGTLALKAFLERFVGGLLGVDAVSLTDQLPGLVVLLDGLDEVVTQGGRRAVLDQAAELAREGALVLVSGRDHVVDDLLAEHRHRWEMLTLREPTVESAGPLVNAILRARGVDPALAERLSADLKRHADFGRFVQNPMLLTFLVVLATLNRHMPSQRTELYRDLLEMLITTWRRLRVDPSGRALTRGAVLKVVAPLGWELVRRGVGGLTEPELLAVLIGQEQQLTTDLAAAHLQATQRLEQLRSDTALLRTSDGLWRFNHPTIAEYLAAEAALQDGKKLHHLVEDVYTPTWSQVVAFTLAISVDLAPRDDVARALLDALEDQARRRGVYDAKIPRTLSACLVEAAGIPPQRKRSLADHMLRVALHQKLSELARYYALFAVTAAIERGDRDVHEQAAAWLSAPRLQTLDFLARWTPPVILMNRIVRALEAVGLDTQDLRRQLSVVAAQPGGP